VALGAPAPDLDDAARVRVDPARSSGVISKADGTSERVQPVRPRRNALAVGARQPEIGARGREEAVDAHVPLRDHRVEDAVHPRGRGERRLVGREAVARADDAPCGRSTRSSFARVHDVRSRRAKNDSVVPPSRSTCRRRAEERASSASSSRAREQRPRVKSVASGRSPPLVAARRRAPRQRQRAVDEREVGRRARAG
jgi:hypothetical protein